MEKPAYAMTASWNAHALLLLSCILQKHIMVGNYLTSKEKSERKSYSYFEKILSPNPFPNEIVAMPNISSR